MPDYSLSDIAAVAGNGGGNNNGFGNDSGAWWLLVLFALLGGFGNNGRGGYGGGYGGAGFAGGNELYPWLAQQQNVNDGFRDQMLQTTIQGVNQGVQNLATQLCNCCGDIQMALCNGFNGVNTNMMQGFAGVEANANARQIANMQQGFGFQTAVAQGFNGLQAQLADCCCENRLATANQTATILAENCADRAALSDGVRDIIASQTAGTQRIIDQLCQDKIDAKNERIQSLENQLTMAQLAASQTAQTSQILADNARQTTALEQYLNPAPIPSYIVANPNCCQQNFGCGCN